MSRTSRRRLARAFTVLAAVTLLAGCRQDMHDQAKYEALEASPLFDDGAASRRPVEGTVARGHLAADSALHQGLDATGELVTELPLPLTAELVARGRERYDIFCSPCHGRTGDGLGMIVRRGYKQPASFHEARLRQAAVGYYFNVMTNGFGQMSSYASQVPPRDRWAIAAYIRALQLAREVPREALAPRDLEALAAAGQPAPQAATDAEGHG